MCDPQSLTPNDNNPTPLETAGPHTPHPRRSSLLGLHKKSCIARFTNIHQLHPRSATTETSPTTLLQRIQLDPLRHG
jgi:hypothetical protein